MKGCQAFPSAKQARIHPFTTSRTAARAGFMTSEVALFLRQILRHLPGQVIALLDNSNTHRGGPVRQLCQRVPRLHLEYFPSYALELSPDGGVWGILKGKLANGRPDDLEELADHLQREFRCLKGSQPKLRGCIRQSKLPISLP